MKDVRYRLDRSSVAYQRATKAGFTFEELRFFDDDPSCWSMGLRFTLDFTCVCGRKETFMQALTQSELDGLVIGNPLINGDLIDAVMTLEKFGSFGREHLRKDGYTEEQIDRIREPWDGLSAFKSGFSPYPMGINSYKFNSRQQRRHTMADTDENPNPPVTTDERYTAAVGQSNMRMEFDRRSPADVIVAAALHHYDIGRMLQRLRAEWDCQSLKKPADAEAIANIAGEYTKEPAWSPHAGLVRQDVRDVKTDEVIGVEYINPLVLAAKHAAEWRAHEQGLVFQRLKTLPELRRVLCEWLGSESRAHTVAAVLRWWLSPTCPTCEGRKFKVATGTNRTTGRACRDCTRPGRVQGQAKIPHSGEGRRLLDFIGQCVAEAARATRAINR